jgi:hypothetical protein
MTTSAEIMKIFGRWNNVECHFFAVTAKVCPAVAAANTTTTIARLQEFHVYTIPLPLLPYTTIIPRTSGNNDDDNGRGAAAGGAADVESGGLRLLNAIFQHGFNIL